METDKKDKLLKVAKKIQTWIHAHPRKATIAWDVIHELDDAIASLESELAEQKPLPIEIDLREELIVYTRYMFGDEYAEDIENIDDYLNSR